MPADARLDKTGRRGEHAAMYDVYLKRTDSSWRCATAEGAGLPAHLMPSEWELLPAGISPVSDHAEEDIEEYGFCFFRLVGLQLAWSPASGSYGNATSYKFRELIG